MIIDKIDRWESYAGIHPYLKEAVNFALNLKDQPVGRYECESLPEGCVYAMIQEGKNGPYEDGRVETHRKYLDMQIMLEGGEIVYYADIEELKEVVPYNQEADIQFYAPTGQPGKITAGMFYLVLPHDGHMACREIEGIETFRKIVLKVRLV